MIRSTSLSSLLILVYLVVNLHSKSSYYQDICEDPNLLTYEDVLFENNSSKYSHYYRYSQRISLNQFHPVVNGSFSKSDIPLNVTPKFPFEYYGTNVSRFQILNSGYITIIEKGELGYIKHRLPGEFQPEYEILDNNETLAVKWYLRKYADGLTAKVTNMIHRNGKISFFYEDMPEDPKDDDMNSRIQVVIPCENKEQEVVRVPEIIVSEEWIKSNTLVEFEPIKSTCWEHNSTEKCLNATTSIMKCIWCEKTNKCINSRQLIVNNCHIETDTTEPTEQTENTSPITEVHTDDEFHETTPKTERYSNTTPKIIQYSKHNGTLYYLQILMPMVILFWVVCTGLVIWIWLSRRKKNRLIHSTTDVKCAWCEETDKYIQSNDKNSPEVNVIDHRVEDVDHLNTETFSYQN